jgi:hypothetical protein
VDVELIVQGEWGAITVAHFHPNTHECYGKRDVSASPFEAHHVLQQSSKASLVWSLADPNHPMAKKAQGV